MSLLSFSLTLAFGLGSPWMLWGLLGVAVPVVIHLLRQRRPRVVPWAAMRFVRAALEKRQRQIRIDSWLQVIVRGLLLACFAFALAEPFFEQMGLAGSSGGAVHRIIVLDSSYSMGYGPAGARAFDRAKAMAREIVEAGRPGDAVNLARLAGHSPRVVIRRPAFEHSDILDEIERLSLLDERGDLLASLKPLPSLLQQSPDPNRKEIVIISDLQGETWLSANATVRTQTGQILRELANTARLTVVDVGAESPENAAVVGLESRRPVATPGGTIDLSVELRNFGRSARPATRLEVAVDGVVRHRESFDLPGVAAVVRPVLVAAGTGADAAIEARIDDDPLLLDNVRRLVVPLRRAIRVLIVEGGDSAAPDSAFVELALAPPDGEGDSPSSAQPSFQPQTIPLNRLQEQRMSEFDSVILCDVAALTEEEAGKLETFVSAGGGLILSLGERANPEEYERLLVKGGTGMLVTAFEAPTSPLSGESLPWSISEPESRHPITQAFAGNPDAGLLTTPIFRYRPVREPLPTAARVVLRLSNGAPLILERAHGAGRVVQVQTPFNDQWGSWVVWPSFVPLMHEMVLFSIRGQLARRTSIVDEPIVRSGAGSASGPIAVTIPGGTRIVLDPPAADASESSFDRTDQSGFYEFSPATESGGLERHAVNPDVRESVLSRVSPETLRSELLSEAEVDFVKTWVAATPPTERTESGGGRLVQPVLMLTLGLLILDLLVAGWRR